MTTSQLYPVYCESTLEVGEAAFDGVRRRPIVAINDDGHLIVCCRRTAVKNGWRVEGMLYPRERNVKIEIAENGRLVTKQAVEKIVEKVKAEIDSAFGDLI